MIYEHIKSGDLYRFLFDAWDVEEQKPVKVYMSMGTGVMFTRCAEAFKKGFRYVDDTQSKVKKRPHPYLPDDVKEEGGTDSLFDNHEEQRKQSNE